jgi:hypothetical protein
MLRTFADAEDVERFFADHPTPYMSQAIARTLENIRVRARWIERDGAAIEHWLLGRASPIIDEVQST